MQVAFLWVGQQILLALPCSLRKENNFGGKYNVSVSHKGNRNQESGTSEYIKEWFGRP